MMQKKMIKAVLPGIVALSVGVAGCARMHTDEVYYDETYYENGVMMPEQADVGAYCESDDDCLLTNDDGMFLTEEFTETYVVSNPGAGITNTMTTATVQTRTQTVPVVGDELSASRPASSKAVAVKDKVRPVPVPVETAPEAPVVEVEEPKAAPVPMVKKITTTEVVESDVIAKSEPARKVITTVSEKKTTSRVDTKTGEMVALKTEESTITKEGTTLASRVAYGEEVHEWEAVPGTTLRTLLLEWGEKSGWTVIWKMDRDYQLEAGVVFRGTFMEVSGALVRSFARAVPAPIGTFYQGNRVLVINTQEDENAH